MNAAGGYNTRLEWLQRTAGTPDGYGQRRDTYPSQGYLWCALEDVAGNRTVEKESEKQVTSATVRIRNYPAVVPGDRLGDADGGIWTVKTAVAGDNETLCEVEQ